MEGILDVIDESTKRGPKTKSNEEKILVVQKAIREMREALILWDEHEWDELLCWRHRTTLCVSTQTSFLKNMAAILAELKTTESIEGRASLRNPRSAK